MIVVAGDCEAHAEEFSPFGQRIFVENYFLRSDETTWLPAVNGVVFSFLSARVIKEFAAADRR